VHKDLQNFLEVCHKKNFIQCGGAELMVRNRNSGARCGTELQMARRCAVRNRLPGAGAHHWIRIPTFKVFWSDSARESNPGLPTMKRTL